MKACIKVIVVLVASGLWILLLQFADQRLLSKWQGGGLPSPWGELAAVGIALGPPFVACLVVLHQCYPLRSLHTAFRWPVYLGVSAVLSIAALFGGNALGMACGLK
jgi:hypothetical protein